MERGLIARQPVEPLARLLLGAMTEAAVACAGSGDIKKAGAEYSRAFRSLLEAMRHAARRHFPSFFLRWPSVRRRSALSLMKPAASRWS